MQIVPSSSSSPRYKIEQVCWIPDWWRDGTSQTYTIWVERSQKFFQNFSKWSNLHSNSHLQCSIWKDEDFAKENNLRVLGNVILKQITVNLLNLILVFLFATSCIKVGEYEKIYHQRSFLKSFFGEKVPKNCHLIEKCASPIWSQLSTRNGRKRKEKKNNNRIKVGPFLFFNIRITFLLLLKLCRLSVTNGTTKYLTYPTQINLYVCQKLKKLNSFGFLPNILDKIKDISKCVRRNSEHKVIYPNSQMKI
jgi:hypothetical protein